MHAGLLLFVVVVAVAVVAPQGVHFGLTVNRAEARGQLVLSPVRLPEQQRSSRLVHLAANFA